MKGRRVATSALVIALLSLTGCGKVVAGQATWPGAALENVMLTAADFPPGVQYNRVIDAPGGPEGGTRPPAMQSSPQGCSDGLTKLISDSADHGPGAAAEFVAAYNGARMVVTVLTSMLPLERLEAAADRCKEFRTFFDPSDAGIPITTTRLNSERASALVYRQTMRLNGQHNSVYFAFENVGTWAVFGIAFPTQDSSIRIKGTLPQTFLDTFGKQAQRMQGR